MVDVVETLVVYLLWAIFCAIHLHICVVACICAKCVFCFVLFRCSKRTLLKHICTTRKQKYILKSPSFKVRAQYAII
uniref:Putative secreted protein n=1 Tax=Ixodes ricinus TaxID=34613 RepID=A0A0K8REX6_IXORI